MSKRKKIWIAAGAATLILAVAGGAIASGRDKGRLVRTEEVGRRNLVSTVTASGIIQPKRKVDISADISGRVIQLLVDEGQVVDRGDVLLRIDPTAYQAAVRRAEAMVAQAQAQAAQARANLLQARNAAHRADRLAAGEALISTQDLEQARTQAQVAEAQFEASRYAVAQAQASLSEAREALRKTTIAAPMAGRVTRVNIEEGETAIVGTMNNPGSLLLTVADLSVMEARVQVDETDVPYIQHGDSAAVKVDAFPGRILSGRVTRVSSSAIRSPQSAQAQTQGQGQPVDYEVVVTLDDPPPDLRTDLSATAEIVTATRQHVLAVPIIAVTVRSAGGKKFRADAEGSSRPGAGARGEDEAEVEGVFLVSAGKAEFVPVQVGIAGSRYFEVVEGLEGGETVIAGPYSVIRELEEGDAVRLPSPVREGSGARAEQEG